MNHQINIDEAIAIAEDTSFLNESISAGVKC